MKTLHSLPTAYPSISLEMRQAIAFFHYAYGSEHPITIKLGPPRRITYLYQQRSETAFHVQDFISEWTPDLPEFSWDMVKVA